MGVGGGREVQTMGRAPEQAVSEVCQVMALGKEGGPLSCEALRGRKCQNGVVSGCGGTKAKAEPNVTGGFGLIV